MQITGAVVERVLGITVGAGVAAWLLVRSLKRSEDPPLLIFKWVLTLVVGATLAFVALPMADVNKQGGGAFGGIVVACFCAIALFTLWRKNIASLFARPFENLYTGGDSEIEPAPVYSIARTHRNRGRYTEAVVEIRKQLERFPDDFDGALMLASIQAENLNDLPGAEVTLQRWCRQPGRPPRHVAMAMNTLADWQLKFAQDREAARGHLETLQALLPDSEFATLAAQRIAHLAQTDFLLRTHERNLIEVRPGIDNMGLLPAEQQPTAPQADPDQLIRDCVQILTEHPLDTEARERLAVLYADHMGRLDLATDQLEQLITHPHQPPTRVTHWLNLLADVQIRHSAEYDTIRRTLQRIIDLYPGSAASANAQSRIEHLRLVLKGKQKAQTIKLGTYEQDIGLKMKGDRNV